MSFPESTWWMYLLIAPVLPIAAIYALKASQWKIGDAAARNAIVPVGPSTDENVLAWKELYHSLLNLTANPQILPHARDVLLKFLREGVLAERYKSAKRSILHIETYGLPALEQFLQAEDQDVFKEWDVYLKQRAKGANRRLFHDRDSARDWLRNLAPLNLIDGAWLSHIHKATTPFAVRRFTSRAWQTLSEELGDGDALKNHILIYRRLLHDVGVELPPCHSRDFLHEDQRIDDPQIWKTGVGHLLISLFPHDFLPEILGFNLHFERLSAQTLIASRELPELGISDRYFSLHISIDNAHSGHSAMALQIVDDYMSHIQRTGPEGVQAVWRRIQSGYLLSQSLDNGESLQKCENQVLDMLRSKSLLSHRFHCASSARIGKKRLSDWMSALAYSRDDDESDGIISALKTAKPWVYPGNSQKSRLIREMLWDGKMFGAFSNHEVLLMRTWIDSLASEGETAAQAYERLLGIPTVCQLTHTIPSRNDLARTRPILQHLPRIPCAKNYESPQFQPCGRLICPAGAVAIIPLWFTHVCILENVTCSPCRTPDGLATHAIKILRAEMGFTSTDGVAGMHDGTPCGSNLDIISIGLQMLQHFMLPIPSHLEQILELQPSSPAIDLCYDLLGWSIQYNQHDDFLLGLSLAFFNLELLVYSRTDLLSGVAREDLGHIIKRKSTLYTECLRSLETNDEQLAQFCTGYDVGRERLESVLG